MDSDNLSSAIMIGVTTMIGVIVVSAIIIFYNTSLGIVKTVGGGIDYGNVTRNDIESTLLMSGSGNFIKGTSVINLLNYYLEDVNVTISVQDIKYLNEHGAIQTVTAYFENDISARAAQYKLVMQHILDNQDFLIDVQTIDEEAGKRIITIKGV